MGKRAMGTEEQNASPTGEVVYQYLSPGWIGVVLLLICLVLRSHLTCDLRGKCVNEIGAEAKEAGVVEFGGVQTQSVSAPFAASPAPSHWSRPTRTNSLN